MNTVTKQSLLKLIAVTALLASFALAVLFKAGDVIWYSIRHSVGPLAALIFAVSWSLLVGLIPLLTGRVVGYWFKHSRRATSDKADL